MKWLLSLLLSGSICFGQSTAEQAVEEAKSLGAQQNFRDVTGFIERIKKDINYPSENADGIPNVAETSYYDSNNMENAAFSEVRIHETGKLVQEGSSIRPKFSFDPKKDPTFKRYDEISDKASSLSETYSGCTELPVGNDDVTKTKKKSCFVFGIRERVSYSCQVKLDVSCANSNANRNRPYYVADFRISGDSIAVTDLGGGFFSLKADRIGRCADSWFEYPCCKVFKSKISFYIDDIKAISHFGFDRVAYDDWLDIQVNGSLVYRAIGPHQGTYLSKDGQECEHGRLWLGNLFSARRHLKQGWNTLTLLNQVYDGGGIDLKLRLSRRYLCQEKDNFRRECNDRRDFSDRRRTRKQCVTSAGHRNIQGIPIYRECWEWREEYSALEAPKYTREASCNRLIGEGCTQVFAKCEDQKNTYCVKQNLTFSCPYLDAARHVTLCGDLLQCPDSLDGNCAEEFKNQFNKDSSEDFKRAATGLAVASEIVKNIDQDHISAFKGHSRKCGTTRAGASNCCKSGGWANDIGLSKCNAHEKELGLAREAHKTVYVGNYKSGGVVDRRKYEVYCIYPSKLARIIVEQGKKQKGQGFGHSRSPDCSGFSLQELESLNMDSMDFSEFYSDVMAKAKGGSTPTSAEAILEIQRRIKEKMQRKTH